MDWTEQQVVRNNEERRRTQSQEELQSFDRETSSFWKERYKAVEQSVAGNNDTIIRTRELESLVFDFRFWMGQPGVSREHVVVESGLMQSASRRLRFVESPEPTGDTRGHIIGHPSNETGIECKQNIRHVKRWHFKNGRFYFTLFRYRVSK